MTGGAGGHAVSVRPRLLFVSLTNDLGLDRIPAEMARHGVGSAVLSPSGFHCASSSYSSRRFGLPHHRGIGLDVLLLRRRLEATSHRWSPDFVVALDDKSACLLRGIAVHPRTSRALRRILERSLGSPDGYATVCSRLGVAELAARLGLRAPLTRQVADVAAALETAAGWHYPVVLKLEHSCGGHGVTIVRSPDELRAAFPAFGVERPAWPRRFKRAVKRMVWSAAGFLDGPDAPPILQSHVEGALCMHTVAAWQGRTLEGVSFAAECIHPEPTGTSTVVRHIENLEMDETAARVVAELGCSGVVSFDFILDAAGRAHLIEVNPRAIGSGHLGRLFGHDIYGALAARLQGLPVAVTPLLERRAVALFPKELLRDPDSAWLRHDADVLHDIPWDDPPLLAAYARWIDRHHPDQAGQLRRLLSESAPPCQAGPSRRASKPRHERIRGGWSE